MSAPAFEFPGVVPPDLPVLSTEKVLAEKLIPMDLIRQHTKTDDIETISDELLSVYRDAALAAAEAYTGLLLREQRIIHQSASVADTLRRGLNIRPYYTVALEYPTIDGIVYVYGGMRNQPVRLVKAAPGDKKVRVPLDHYALDVSSCCRDSCGKPANYWQMLMYRAGMPCDQMAPPCIIMGALKYIAFLVANPGDGNQAGVNLANVNPQASRNNASWQSGAIEEWRLCTREF